MAEQSNIYLGVCDDIAIGERKNSHKRRETALLCTIKNESVWTCRFNSRKVEACMKGAGKEQARAWSCVEERERVLPESFSG